MLMLLLSRSFVLLLLLAARVWWLRPFVVLAVYNLGYFLGYCSTRWRRRR